VAIIIAKYLKMAKYKKSYVAILTLKYLKMAKYKQAKMAEN
jgi:hypothetical protein